jgi:uncharacterized protein
VKNIYKIKSSDDRSKYNSTMFALVFIGLILIFSYNIGSASAAVANKTVQSSAINPAAPPTVSSINLANNTGSVLPNKVIKITFSESIKAGNMLIELKDINGKLNPITTSINGNLLTINHTEPLNYGKYTLILNTGSITNLANVKLAFWAKSFFVGYNIRIFDPTIGGNVTANKAISQNIPLTDLSSQIFKMTHNGSVILKFGNGNGPKLLMSVGVHGNEPQANIAAMKYLEYIKNKHFNGTLYIIPFDIPKDTALNTRYYNGLDPNRIANINGTPSWKIVQFARANGINYLLDVHSGGGVGLNGFVYQNIAPTNKEKNWSSYIVSKTHCLTGVDKADSQGMIRDSAHSYSINSITLETERDSSSVMVAAETEFKMILAATQYLGFP